MAPCNTTSILGAASDSVALLLMCTGGTRQCVEVPGYKWRPGACTLDSPTYVNVRCLLKAEVVALERVTQNEHLTFTCDNLVFTLQGVEMEVMLHARTQVSVSVACYSIA